MGADYIPPHLPRFLTLDAPPEGRFCRVVRIPDTPEWVGTFDGLFSLLTNPNQWRQYGALTEEEQAEAWLAMFLDQTDVPMCIIEDGYPTPFWDEASDLEDELSPEAQIWYGEVTDPDDPPAELEFIENAAIWAITGFVAYAAGIGSAVFFNTIAPRFVLAWKAGDVGEVIRVVIDAADYGTVDTSTVSPGEIISIDVLPDQELENHDILLVKVS